jgi:hypothetical protein
MSDDKSREISADDSLQEPTSSASGDEQADQVDLTAGSSDQIIAKSDDATASSASSSQQTGDAVVQGTTPSGSADADKIEMFYQGWWSLARQLPAFASRIGGDITPFAVVVHTTDMVPGALDGLLHRWSTEAGSGDCAHFIIGRDATQGIVQLAPITKNANHAGGDGHGSFVAPNNQKWHPNLVSVGIEVHCAGGLYKVNGNWFLLENGVAQGPAIPDEDVIQDENRADRAWHKVTDYQYEQLGALLDGLEDVLAPLPASCTASSIEPPPAWGVFATGRVVGHVSLHASQRNDPWPATCNWIRSRK